MSRVFQHKVERSGEHFSATDLLNCPSFLCITHCIEFDGHWMITKVYFQFLFFVHTSTDTSHFEISKEETADICTRKNIFLTKQNLKKLEISCSAKAVLQTNPNRFRMALMELIVNMYISALWRMEFQKIIWLSILFEFKSKYILDNKAYKTWHTLKKTLDSSS